MPLSNPVDDLLPEMAAAVEKWKFSNTPLMIKERIFSRLDKSRDDIVLKLLGFKPEYGGYSLDHCNGRSGNSPAGDYLIKASEAAVKEWLGQVIMPELTPERRESIQKGCIQAYESSFRTGLMAAMKKKADDDIKAVMDELAKSQNIDKYLKVLGLIGADQE
jgi:hypothetical protein